jgi:hypothetical protein
MGRFALFSGLLIAGCAGMQFPIANSEVGYGEAPLFITEVAHSASHGPSRSDKVEVYCVSSAGCESYRVCDTDSGCSAAQSGLSDGQRAVVSRGNEISPRDQVWLASQNGVEFPGTRVGAFACKDGESESRTDCATSVFGGCAPPTLGTSFGTCDESDMP